MRTFGKHLTNLQEQHKQNIKLNKDDRQKFTIQKSQNTKKTNKNTQNNQQKQLISHMQEHEVKCCYKYTIKALDMREQLFKWAVAKCRLFLQLRNQTIQHTLRLYDKYHSIKGQLAHDLYEAKLTLLTCLFISSKYQEIYPPVLTDFEYAGKFQIGTREILKKQQEIIMDVQCQLTISLASSWYHVMYGVGMPEWGILCYPSISVHSCMRSLAEAVRKVENQNYDEIKQSEVEVIQRKVQKVIEILQKINNQ